MGVLGAAAAEIAAGHFWGLGDVEDAEKSGGDIAEGASRGEFEAIVFGKQDEGNWIGGVVGVRAAGDGIDHGFGVAVIGGNDPRAAFRLQRLIQSAQTFVHRFDGFDRRF